MSARSGSNTSHAGPGEGITAPDEIIVESIPRKFGAAASTIPESGYLLIRWDGNGYDKNSAWIKVERDIISNLKDLE
jgi:hypothetical protein